MVLFFPIIAAIPTVIGISEGIAEKNRAKGGVSTDPLIEKEQMRKFILECYCDQNSKRAKEVHGGKVVLRDGKLWIEPKTQTASPAPSHPFTGFYVQYPDPDIPPTLGLVSSISDDPPMLNWIYIDRSTRELKYGNRTQSREHIVGPWGWDSGDDGGPGGLTFKSSEGAVLSWEHGKEGQEGGWKILWEKEEGSIKDGLIVSLERRWIEPREEVENEHTKTIKGTIKQGKQDTDGQESDEKEKHTETTFNITHTSMAVKKKKKNGDAK